MVFYSGVQPVIADGTAPGKRHRSGENRERMQERCDPGIIVMAAMLLTVATAGKILLESNLKPNLQKLVNRNYAAMSFRIIMPWMLDQVQEYLRENTGKNHRITGS